MTKFEFRGVFSMERRLQLVVFLSGAVLMSLELLGSRVLAPSFGSSIFVWGSLISVFLTALAVGYGLGGRLADRRPSPSTISMILSAAAVLILPAVQWAPPLLQALVRSGLETRWSALTASMILFLPPSLAIGMVSPFAVRLGVRQLATVGSVAGGYSALSTAGSILGTLLTAFLLIPSFPVQALLLLLAGTLAFCGLLMVRDLRSVSVAGAATLTCALSAFLQASPQEAGDEKILLVRDSAYHHIVVAEMDRIRHMRFDNLRQGAVFLDDPSRPVYAYAEGLSLAWALRPGIRRVCQVGLGTGAVPRMMTRLLPDVSVDSVEIDPVVRDIAKQYFLYEESDKVRTIVEDGRVFLARGGDPYDLIFLDAYNGTGLPFHLMTREFFQIARGRLKPEGVFAANFVGSLMGRDSRLFWASYQTIRREFGQVYILSPELAAGSTTFQGNLILLATISADPVASDDFRRRAAELGARWRLRTVRRWGDSVLRSPSPPPGMPELTDAQAPVEALQGM
jgi:spermidine synthase